MYLKENCFDFSNVYLCWTELFEMELFLILKLYLRLNELFELELFY